MAPTAEKMMIADWVDNPPTVAAPAMIGKGSNLLG